MNCKFHKKKSTNYPSDQAGQGRVKLFKKLWNFKISFQNKIKSKGLKILFNQVILIKNNESFNREKNCKSTIICKVKK
jgi:hypothetical protein